MQQENLAQQPARPVLWIGLDVSKKTIDAAIRLSDRENPTGVFERTPEGMKKLVVWARTTAPHDASLRAICEATGVYSLETMAWILEADASLAPACVNPLQAKRFAQSLGLRNKTDQVDARMLAHMGAERTPAAWEPPTPTYRELRSLVRERRELVEEQTRLKNRAQEGSDSTFVVRERDKHKKSLKAIIERIDKQIARVVAGDHKLAADVKLLLTIPGVGMVTAVTVLAELGDLRRFASGRQISAFTGVSPRRFESGTSVHGRTRLCKQGNPSARAILYMSALTSSRMDKGMKKIYDRLVARGKHPMSAIGALMRRQLILMRAILVCGKPYAAPVEKIPESEKIAIAS